MTLTATDPVKNNDATRSHAYGRGQTLYLRQPAVEVRAAVLQRLKIATRGLHQSGDLRGLRASTV